MKQSYPTIDKCSSPVNVLHTGEIRENDLKCEQGPKTGFECN
jgi:hypothetical protein